MESSKSETPKLTEMVMCGDHSSVTKTVLHIKETKAEDQTDDKRDADRALMSYDGIVPSLSRSEAAAARGERARGVSDHRRLRSPDARPRPYDDRALVHAALGSARWPPYLVAVWAAALLLTHVLHALTAALHTALPKLRRVCQQLVVWAESRWKSAGEGRGRAAAALAGAAGAALYVLYGALLALHAAAAWAVRPPHAPYAPAPPPPPPPAPARSETRLTEYAYDDDDDTALRDD